MDSLVSNRYKIIKWALLISAVGNLWLSYPFTNIIIVGIPFNELLMTGALFSILIPLPTLLNVFKPLFFLNCWALFYLLFSAISGFLTYGIIALRDATHLIEVWWLYVSYYFFEKWYSPTLLKKLVKVVNWLTILCFLNIIVGKQLPWLTINGYQGTIPLFGNTSGGASLVIIFSLTLNLLIRKLPVQTKISTLMIILNLTMIMLQQSRHLYISLLCISLFFAFTFSFDKIRLIRNGIVILIVVSVVGSLPIWQNFSRFGTSHLGVTAIVEHLGTSFGKSSAHFVGASGGMGIRIDWARENINETSKQFSTLFFGRGCGFH